MDRLCAAHTWYIHIWHDSTSFIHDTTHTYATWLIHSCANSTSLCVCVCVCVWVCVCVCVCVWWHGYVWWLIHMWHNSFAYNTTLSNVAWLIHEWVMTHSYVTWLIRMLSFKSKNVYWKARQVSECLSTRSFMSYENLQLTSLYTSH